jgi:hypothetical protein
VTASIEEQTWTVVGYWQESGERYLDYYDAGTPELAEELAHLYAESRSLHLGVCAVFEGKLTNADHHTWTDPSARTQEEMDQIRREADHDAAPVTEEPESARRWSTTALVALLSVVAVFAFVLGLAI